MRHPDGNYDWLIIYTELAIKPFVVCECLTEALAVAHAGLLNKFRPMEHIGVGAEIEYIVRHRKDWSA